RDYLAVSNTNEALKGGVNEPISDINSVPRDKVRGPRVNVLVDECQQLKGNDDKDDRFDSFFNGDQMDRKRALTTRLVFVSEMRSVCRHVRQAPPLFASHRPLA